MTINSFKRDMMAKAAKRGGVWEDFGQSELRKLKDRYAYNPYGTPKERSTARQIDALNEWAKNYTGGQS